MHRGFIVSGSLNDLDEDDGVVMRFRPGPVLVSTLDPLFFELAGVSPTAAPQQIRMRIDSTGNTPNVVERVEAFDFDANAWVLLAEGLLPLANHHIDVEPANPARFVGPNNMMRMRFAYHQVGPVLIYPWLVNLDRAIWRID
jgi:hypothetical protein